MYFKLSTFQEEYTYREMIKLKNIHHKLQNLWSSARCNGGIQVPFIWVHLFIYKKYKLKGEETRR